MKKDFIIIFTTFIIVFVITFVVLKSLLSIGFKDYKTHEDYDYALAVVMSREDTGDGEYYYQMCEYGDDVEQCGYFLSTQLFSVDELVLWIVKGDNIELVDLS